MTNTYRLEKADFIAFEEIAKSCQDGLIDMDYFNFQDGLGKHFFRLASPPKKTSGVWILRTFDRGNFVVCEKFPKKEPSVKTEEQEAKPLITHQVIELNEKEWRKLFPLMTNIDSCDMIRLDYAFPGLVKEFFQCTKYWKTKKGHYLFLNHVGGSVEFKKLSQSQQPAPKEETSSSCSNETTEQKKTVSVGPEQDRLTNEIKGWNFWNQTVDEKSEEFIQFMVEILTLSRKSDPVVSEDKSHYLNYQNWLKNLRLSRTRKSVIRFIDQIPDCVFHEVKEWLNTLVGQAYANTQAKQIQK